MVKKKTKNKDVRKKVRLIKKVELTLAGFELGTLAYKSVALPLHST